MDPRHRIETCVAEFLLLLDSDPSTSVEGFVAGVEPDIRGEVEQICRTTVKLRAQGRRRPVATKQDAVPERIGSYSIIDRIGRGGMGTVFRARQAGMRREVAIKVVRPDRRVIPDFLRRFDREAKLQGDLDHPGIVKIYDRGEADGQVYIAMELVAGRSLRDAIQRLSGEPDESPPPSDDEPESAPCLLPWSHPHSVPRAVRLVADLSSAVAYAHGKGVTHRDLKPENVMIGSGGEPRIIDFGLASEISLETSGPGTIGLGTLAYLPPDRISGTSIPGWRSDVWALGVILYEVLLLRRPFQGEDEDGLRASIASGRYPRPSALRPALAGDLERVLDRALARDAADRYEHAAELEQDLRRFLAGVPVAAGSIGSAERAVRHLRRHKRRYFIGACLAGVIASAVMISGRRERRRVEADLLRQAEAPLPALIADTDSVDRDLIKAVLSRQVPASVLERSEDLSSSTRSRLIELRAEWEKTIRGVHSRALRRIEDGKGSAPGVPIEEFRPPSEPEIFRAVETAVLAASALADGDLPDASLASFPTLTITGFYAGADVARTTVAPLNLVTGMPGDPILTVHGPLNAQPIPPGFYMIRVAVPGVGLAEYIRDLPRSAEEVIHPRVLPIGPMTSAMCRIPGGRYTVGQRFEAADPNRDLYAARALEFPEFYMDRYETTCAEYRDFLLAQPSDVRPSLFPKTWGRSLEDYDAAWDRTPVRGVSWMAAQLYAEFRGKRLPTWQEWQVAALGPDHFLYPWGKEAGDIAARSTVGLKREAPPPAVGSSPLDQGPFGLFDCFGSVREWTAIPLLVRAGDHVYPHMGWRVTQGYSHSQSVSPLQLNPWGLRGITYGAYNSTEVGLRCLRVHSEQ